MYTLYDFLPSGNCYKIRLLLNQLHIPYQRINVDILQQQSRTAEFLNINPNGKTPVLEHDNHILAESNAILWYLAKQSQFLPEDDFSQAQVLQWMFFEQFSHEPYLAKSRYWISILNAEEEYSAQLANLRQPGYSALDVMENHLRENNFFVANQYSIADICLYAYTHVAEEGKFDLSAYSHIHAWFKRIESQPDYIRIDDEVTTTN
jgi:glutathione S-transferase